MNVMAFEPMKKEQAMKTIYLGKNAEALEWSTTDELKELCKKYDIRLGTNVVIGDKCRIEDDVNIRTNARIGYGVHLGYGSIVEDRVRIGDAVTLERYVRIRSDAEIGYSTRIEHQTTIGKRSIIGNCVSIGDHTGIGDDNHIEYGVNIGYDVSTGDGVRISKNVRIPITITIPDGHQIERIVTYYNTNQNHASAWIHGGELFIALLGYTQTKDEWDKDFWGTSNEYPEGNEPNNEQFATYKSIVAMGGHL